MTDEMRKEYEKFKRSKPYILEELGLNLYKKLISFVERADNINYDKNMPMINHGDKVGNVLDDILVQNFNIYEQMLSKSLIISIYSDLEKGLNDLCRSYHNFLRRDKKLEDFSHPKKSIIKQATDYLNYVGLKYVTKKEYWKPINEWRKLRNCLTHNQDMIKNSEQHKIKNILKRNIVKLEEYLYSEEYSYIYVDFKSVNEFLDIVTQYLDYVFKLEPHIED